MSHPHPELTAPGPLAEGGLRVIPLGGLGEVGRNMTVFEYAGRLLIVDCGVLFPEDHHPGVDLILPDFDPIRDRLDDVEALVLTHGHEDHIGATPYLLRERGDIPLVGSELTLALLDSKLREHRLRETVHHVVSEGDRISLGPFDLEFVAVNHSIPDALAVAIRTPARPGAAHRRLQDGPAAAGLRGSPTCGPSRGSARKGSTSSSPTPPTPRCPVSRPPRSTSRRCSTGSSPRAPSGSSWPASRRTCTACSRCSTPRSRTSRKVGYVGRSMVRNMGIAQDLGYLHVPAGVMVDAKDLADLPPERQVLISTGSQGEPLSALSRIAQNSHDFVHIQEGDTVILASSLIPGNENAVYRVINGLSRWGARVVHKGNALVHVSGHASAGELLYCYNIVRPRNVLPVHGEIRHMRANAELAKSTGIPDENVVVAEDGVVVDLIDGVARIAGKVDVGYVFVDGASVGDITESSLKDRRILGEEGFVSVIVVVDSVTGKVVSGPEIHARGFAENDSMFDDIKQPIIDALDAAVRDGIGDSYQLQQTVRRVVGRWVNKTHRRRPMIIPVVIEA